MDRIRASPVVHADETGWRENGVNGYVWTFSTPTERYFLRRGRGKEVVDEALGDSSDRVGGRRFTGVLVSDFSRPTIITTAPSNAAVRTCCATSTTCEPSTLRMNHWPSGLGQSTSSMPRPKPSTIPRHVRGARPN